MYYIGSGGITLRGDSVESFMARRVDIPLDGVAGVSGSIQVEFIWHPQLLSSKKTQTSVLTSSRTYAHSNLGAVEASAPLPRSSTISSTASSQRVRTMSAESSTSDSVVPERSGSQSFESASRYSVDDAVSIAPSQMEDMGNITNATGRPGKVQFTFIEARGLRGVDKSGTSDPYVRVKVGKSQVFKSKYIAKTLTPEWYIYTQIVF
jgi:Ca2+-dependent lipid-binding protein